MKELLEMFENSLREIADESDYSLEEVIDSFIQNIEVDAGSWENFVLQNIED